MMRVYALITVFRKSRLLPSVRIRRILSIDQSLRIKCTDVSAHEVRGRVDCLALGTQGYGFDVREIELHDRFFIDRLAKEILDPPGSINCVLQISDFEFFPIPFRTSQGFVYLQDTYQRISDFHYFPIKVTFNEKSPQVQQFQESLIQKGGFLGDISSETSSFSKFVFQIIRIAVVSNLLDRASTFFGLRDLLEIKLHPMIKWLCLIPLFCLAFLLVNKPARTGLQNLLLEWSLSWNFISDFVYRYAALSDLVSSYPVLGSSIAFFLLLAAAFLIFQPLRMRLSREGFLSLLFSTNFDAKRFEKEVMLLELSGYPAKFAHQDADRRLATVFEKVSSLSRYRATFLIITIAVISFLIGTVFRTSP